MFDDEMARFFLRQHGLITRVQAQGNDDAIRHRVRLGRWVRVANGLYRLAGVPVTWEQRALPRRRVRRGGVAPGGGRAAWRVGFRQGPLDITVAPGRNNRSPLAVVPRSVVPPADRRVRAHIQATSPARTLVDLARVVFTPALAEAVDDVLCRRLVALDRLLDRPLPAALARVFDAWTPGALPGGAAEMDLVRTLLAAGFPMPVRQHWLAAAHARVDLAYPQSRIAIELDSFRWHAGRRPFETDRSRGNRIVAAGWHLLRAVPGDHHPLVAALDRLLTRAA